ncbi:Ferredoxin, 2Fe-2S [Minicystis rosea]|nr:Ferredoxin, 2Fe-2S [Minicystis rosea]
MSNKKIIQVIAEQAWIDRAADPLQNAIRGVLDRAPRLASFLHGDWLDHPLHAALVSIPVGAFATGLVLDGLELAGRRNYRRAADTVTAIGLGGAVVAVLPGLADWSRTEGAAKRVGFVHASLNVAIAGLYGASLVARRARHRKTGIALSIAGFSLAGFSAWLGGELAFRFAVGVRPRPEGRPTAPPERATSRRAESRL